MDILYIRTYGLIILSLKMLYRLQSYDYFNQSALNFLYVLVTDLLFLCVQHSN